MTEQEKELLLKDLCARLPYGVKCQIDYDNEEDADLGIERYCDDRIVSVCTETEEIGLYEASEYFYPDEIKPYLRPMSSITEEEVMEWAKMKYGENSKEVKNFVSWKIFRYDTSCTIYINFFVETEYGQQGYSTVFRIDSDDCKSIKFFDWLNAHHFDYRGLISMGLALEAPEGMYNLKKIKYECSNK